MSSPFRKTWQDCKKQMGVPDKAFKQDLGPNLDKAQDAYDAVIAENNKKIKLAGFSDPTPDLPKMRSKIAAALPLHEKVQSVAKEYKGVVDKMDKQAPGVAKALTTLTDIITHFHQQDATLRQHIPSEVDAAKFKQAFMNAAIKQI